MATTVSQFLIKKGSFYMLLAHLEVPQSVLESPRHSLWFKWPRVCYMDGGNKRVCVWAKEGTYKRNFNLKYASTFISATCKIISNLEEIYSETKMKYTLTSDHVMYAAAVQCDM